MTITRSGRKARVDAPFSVTHPGDPSLLVPAGHYLVEELGGEVALRMQRGDAAGFFILPNLQFQQLLDRRQIVFVSW